MVWRSVGGTDERLLSRHYPQRVMRTTKQVSYGNNATLKSTLVTRQCGEKRGGGNGGWFGGDPINNNNKITIVVIITTIPIFNDIVVFRRHFATLTNYTAVTYTRTRTHTQQKCVVSRVAEWIIARVIDEMRIREMIRAANSNERRVVDFIWIPCAPPPHQHSKFVPLPVCYKWANCECVCPEGNFCLESIDKNQEISFSNKTATFRASHDQPTATQ